MIPGIQTHIEGWTDPTILKGFYDRRYRFARIAALTCTDDIAVSMVKDAKAAGFRVVVTLQNPERIKLVAPYLDPSTDLVECRNEDDGDLAPLDYRQILNAFCVIGRETGIPIGGPTCSNTNAKCIRWATWVKGRAWPAGMKYLTWHSYDPHENTKFKEMEALADGLPIVITEFGYPSHAPHTEADQAQKARELWLVYAKYHGAIWFQGFDGLDLSIPDNCFGAYSVKDNRFKPVAETVPTTDQEELVSDATFCISQGQSFAVGGGFATFYPKGQTDTVLSIQPDGRKETRRKEAIGAWETWKPSADGQRAVFHETSEFFAFPLVP